MSNPLLYDEKAEDTSDSHVQPGVVDTALGAGSVEPESDAQPLKATASSHDEVIQEPVASMSQHFDENTFYSAPEEALAGVSEGNEPPSQALSAQLEHPVDFKPFFTLVEDRESGEHHHPTVHYIFSDDDPDIMTNATLHTLESLTDQSQPTIQQEHLSERVILLDMAADGKTISAASSLSPEWQAIEAHLSQAPSWGENAKNGDGRLLLRIAGQKIGALQALVNGQELNGVDVEDLVAAFCSRLDELNQVMRQTVLHQTEEENS